MVAPAEEKIEIEITKVVFHVQTRSNIVKPDEFEMFDLTVGIHDDMAEVRRAAWEYCHFTNDHPFPEDKLYDASLNIVCVDSTSGLPKKIGVFKCAENNMSVNDWLDKKDIEINDVTLVMPLNNELHGGGTWQLRAL